MSSNSLVRVIGFFVVITYPACALTISGPLHFNIANSDDYQIMNKAADICVIANVSFDLNFKIGNVSYSQITVCENGYIIPGVAGIPETAPALTSPGDFDSPATTIIAAGLIDNTRIDNFYDKECIYSSEKASYYKEPICLKWATAFDNFGQSTNAELAAISYNLNPFYAENATGARNVQAWKNASMSRTNYYKMAYHDGVDDESLASSFFYRFIEFGKYVKWYLNNIVIAGIRPSDFPIIENITGDPDFNVSWAISISWYKVAQPYYIIDAQNTFQLALACMESLKCVLLFDYFELLYVEQNGEFMRAGVTGPNTLVSVELPGSGFSNVSDLVSGTNVAVPGLWLYELNQLNSGPIILSYEQLHGPGTTSQPLSGDITSTDFFGANDVTTAGPIAGVPKRVNVTLLESTENSVNLSVVDFDGNAQISDIVASCKSAQANACDNVAYEMSNVSTTVAWLELSNLYTGTSYEITVNESSFDGVPVTLMANSIIFCTVPVVGDTSFEIEPISQTSFAITLISNAANFDNGTVSVFNLTDYIIVETSFDQNDFPMTFYDLPSEARELNISFTFSVGTSTNCGNGAIVTSDAVFQIVDLNDQTLAHCGKEYLAISISATVGMLMAQLVISE